MSFIVTGCGRSGTMFLARLFNMLGVRTSHEEFFTAYTPPRAILDFQVWLRRAKTDGEVSNLACPAVRGIAPEVHRAVLVRNPIAVIASLVGGGEFSPESRYRPNVKFAFRHCPELDHDDSPVVLAMKYWLYWNRLALFAGDAKPFRVEDISRGNGKHAIRMLEYLGVTVDRDECGDLLDKIGERFNGGRRDPAIRWGSLPDCAEKDYIMYDAVGYGYSETELEYCDPME